MRVIRSAELRGGTLTLAPLYIYCKGHILTMCYSERWPSKYTIKFITQIYAATYG